MYLKSLYPWPPPVPDSNVHNCMFGSESDAQPEDYLLHIDAPSGKKRTYYEFRERVRDAATALGASVSDGGLGVSAEMGDIVGILSHNSMVRPFLARKARVNRWIDGGAFRRTTSHSCTRF